MALEWLKGILGEAYTDEIDTAVSSEIGKGFVAKGDFNAVNTAKKDAEKTVASQAAELEELKKVDVAALQAENAELKKVDAAALQADNKKLQDQIALLGKGIPAEKADKYQALAAAYVTDEVDFNAAVDLALKDFPVGKDTGIPGAGGNPVPPVKTGDQKVTFASALEERLGAPEA